MKSKRQSTDIHLFPEEKTTVAKDCQKEIGQLSNTSSGTSSEFSPPFQSTILSCPPKRPVWTEDISSLYELHPFSISGD